MKLQETIEYITSSSQNHEINIDKEDIESILNINGLKQVINIHITLDKIEHFMTEFINQLTSNIQDIKGCLAYFETNPNISLFSINDIMIDLHESFANDSHVIFGTALNQSLSDSEIKCSIIVVS